MIYWVTFYGIDEYETSRQETKDFINNLLIEAIESWLEGENA